MCKCKWQPRRKVATLAYRAVITKVLVLEQYLKQEGGAAHVGAGSTKQWWPLALGGSKCSYFLIKANQEQDIDEERTELGSCTSSSMWLRKIPLATLFHVGIKRQFLGPVLQSYLVSCSVRVKVVTWPRLTSAYLPHRPSVFLVVPFVCTFPGIFLFYEVLILIMYSSRRPYNYRVPPFDLSRQMAYSTTYGSSTFFSSIPITHPPPLCICDVFAIRWKMLCGIVSECFVFHSLEHIEEWSKHLTRLFVLIGIVQTFIRTKLLSSLTARVDNHGERLTVMMLNDTQLLCVN